jgi:hypothetical protein
MKKTCGDPDTWVPFEAHAYLRLLDANIAIPVSK